MPALDRLILEDSTGGQNFGSTATTVSNDTVTRADPAFSVNGAGTQITFNETRYYLVMGQFGAELAGGIGGVRGQYRTQWFSSQAGGTLREGRGTGYARNAQSADDGAVQATAFIRQFSQGTFIEQRVLRTDDDVALRLQRATNSFTRGGIQILALPDIGGHLRLNGPDADPVATDSFQVMTWADQLDIDTDTYGHSETTDPGEITLKEAGHYLVCYNWEGGDISGSGARCGMRSLLQLNGSNVSASNVMNQLRDADSISEATVGFAGIIQTSAPNQVLTVGYRRERAGPNFRPVSGGFRRLMIWKMNDGADYFRVRGANSGTAAGADTTTIVQWNETDELDSTFSRPGDVTRVDMAKADSILWFANVRTTHNATGANQRIQHRLIPRINGFGQTIGSVVSYERNTPGDGSSNNTQSGACIAIVTDDLSVGDRLSVQHANLASTSDSTAVFTLSQSSWTGVAVSTLLADVPPPDPVVTKNRKRRLSRPGLVRGQVRG